MKISDINILERKIYEGYKISYSEAVDLSNIDDKQELYKLSERISRHFMGLQFDTCSIINAKSGKCSEDCKWCSQSKFHDTKIDVYPLIDKQEAVDMALKNRYRGVNRFSLVTSGRTLNDKEIEKASEIYNEIRKVSDINLCASMGLISYENMKSLKDSGVSRYHCNLECAPSFFSTLCTTHTIDDKIRTIGHAKKLGMKICSGGIIGMGETMEQRIELAIKLREIEVDSIPINILNPIKGTPLQDNAPLSKEEILTTLALFRIINPKVVIRFAGGRGALDIDSQSLALKSSVNGALVGDLLTTIGTAVIDSDMIFFKDLGFNLK